MRLRLCLFALVAQMVAGTAAAQSTAPGAEPTPAERLRVGNFEMWAEDMQQTADGYLLVGNAELSAGADTKIFADRVEINLSNVTLIAEGNVVFRNPEGTISAARIELDLTKGTGIFHEANGMMSLGRNADPLQFGGQEPDVYFYGKTIERLGPDKYRITRGEFTTCVQPEPRWQLASGTVEINLNDYAIARNAVLRVKGFPVLYLPIVYYPIRDDERSTGFLLPTYGTSRVRGQALSNGFFWAIGRSQDATFVHDWFSRAGQGIGVEYRYVAGQQSYGDLRARRFYQRQATYVDNGVTRTIAQSTSFEFTGTAVQALTSSLRARARLDYASDIVSQQLYQQDIYRASNPTRVIEGGLSGSWGALSAVGNYQRTEVFRTTAQSLIYGSTPRVTAALTPQRMFGLPIYGGVAGEFARMPYRDVIGGKTVDDRGLSKIDINPSVRVPLSGLTFLALNTNAGFRTTYYTRSNDNGKIVPEPLMRTYLSVRSDIIGPVFNKIWDTPDSEGTERRKHVIEPAFSVDYTSPIENFTRTPAVSDVSDVVVGSTLRLTYGVTNRLFSRARETAERRSGTREGLTIGIQQTYYSNTDAGRFDSTYQSAFGYSRRQQLSPVMVSAKLSPTTAVETNGRLEYDISGEGLKMWSVGGGARGEFGSVSANYNWRHADKASTPDSYLSTSGNLQFRDGRVSTSYGLSWDLARGYVVSQSLTGSYMAQCCGVQAEYQQFNYPESVGIPYPSDRRINFGFVLSGLGTFSNFFGAFGGQ